MTKNKLKHNEQKTEVLLCGPLSRRETVPVDCLSTGEASIPFSNVVKTLGVTLDAELSMEQNISAVDQPSDLVFFQIRPLSKVSPYITYKAASSIDVCLILSKLDYCNIPNFPQNSLNVYRQCRMLLQELSWNAKNKQQQKQQITSLTFLDSFISFPSRNGSATQFSHQSVHDDAPLYLSDFLHKHNPSRVLRSASRSLLDIPGPRDSKTKRLRPASVQICRSLPLECPPGRKHHGEGLHSVFQTFAENHFFKPRDDSQCDCVRTLALVCVLSEVDVAIITVCVCVCVCVRACVRACVRVCVCVFLFSVIIICNSVYIFTFNCYV